MDRIVLYTRRGCHLCEELRERLRLWGLDPAPWTVRDVDRDAEARARYGRRLPVLVVDGRVLLEGRPDDETLARAARALTDGAKAER